MSTLLRDLAGLARSTGVAVDPIEPWALADATASRGIVGTAEALASPADAEGVAATMAWCYEHGVPLTPRGGGTGYAGGVVPDGGIVLALGRMRGVRSLVPLSWRAEVEAGLTTATVQRIARENGLYFPPDPGAAEQSQIGGNVATNAGGPHAFKYGTTGAWVTGVEAVVPPGRIVRFGGSLRKDVAGYDLRSLLVGSEGTLGVITAVTLRFVPPPERRFPVVAFYPDERRGGDAVQSCLASGVVPAALEFLDREAVEIVRSAFPVELPAEPCFAVIAEADGAESEAREGRAALVEALAEGALKLSGPTEAAEIEALWRWRDGVGLAADSVLGGKVSEDVGVPVERLAEAVAGTREIGRRHGLATCSWGHAGDGNLHSTFLLSATDPGALLRAEAAAEELFDLAIELDGTISGEHGVGLVKGGRLSRQWSADAVDLHRAVKSVFDPEGLLNPGKKVP
jgi:glycolate dehydrogenase FAD-linked subunit